MQGSQDDGRRAELMASLGAVRQRITAAAGSAGRDPAEITLVAVTKTYPASDAATLAGLGQLDLGESKDQEARAKASELADLPIRWHLVGRLQTNKARSVAGYAAAVHSVDRVDLAAALARAVGRVERSAPLDVFVQYSFDGDPARGGAVEEDLPAIAETVAGAPGLRLRGVMAVPPRGADPDRAFALLADVSARLVRQYPDARAISAGMSADLEAAVAHGSTHLRVGTALLGRRDPTFR